MKIFTNVSNCIVQNLTWDYLAEEGIITTETHRPFPQSSSLYYRVPSLLVA